MKIKVETYPKTYPKLNTFLNIYQSFKLRRISKSNKELLNNALHQNAELQNLNNQLKYSNEIQHQILNNQIYEIQHRESQKFYKSLLFYYHQSFDELLKLEDINLMQFVLGRDNMGGNALYEWYENSTNLIGYLDELSDKEYCEKLSGRIYKTITQLSLNSEIYKQSLLGKLENSIKDFEDKTDEIERRRGFSYSDQLHIKPKYNKYFSGEAIIWLLSVLMIIGSIFQTINKVQDYLQGLIFSSLFFIISVLIFFKEFIWIKNYPDYFKRMEPLIMKARRQDNSYEQETKEMETSLNYHPVHKLIDEFNKRYQDFEKTIGGLNNFINKITF